MEEKDVLFGLGDPNDAYAKYFDGQSYLKRLTTTGGPMANVTFCLLYTSDAADE